MRSLTVFLLYFSLVLNQSCTGSGPGYASGVTEPALKIPLRNSIKIDGYPADWGKDSLTLRIISDIEGIIPPPADFAARFNIAWDSLGILILAEIRDDHIYEDAEKFWNGDGIELFLSQAKGSENIVQVSVRPGSEISSFEAVTSIYDHRKNDSLLSIPVQAEFARNWIPGGYILEGRVEFRGILNPDEIPGLALQLYFNDSDMEDDSNNYSLPWYPVRESYRNAFAFRELSLVDSARLVPEPELRAVVFENDETRIRVISEKSMKEEKLVLSTTGKRKKISLKPADYGFCSSELVLKEKQAGDEGQIELFNNDQLLISLNHVLLHRVYENKEDLNRFEPEIRLFEIRDHFFPPDTAMVLFTGSSTFRRWKDPASDLHESKILNRGFGGSQMDDLNHYFERIILPYKPSKIFVYEGDNDIARGISPEQFIRECKIFLKKCQEQLPSAEVYFLSIKPSPARFRHWEKMNRANDMLSSLCDDHDWVHFVDISKAFLLDNGKPDPELFIKDRLHFNKQGYQVLSSVLKPLVKP